MLKPQGGSFLRVFLSLFIFIASDVAISVNIFDEGRIKNINLIPTDTLVTELGAMKPQRLRPIAGQILSNISEQKFGDLILARLEYQTASFLTRALFYWDPDKLARVIRYLRENPYKTSGIGSTDYTEGFFAEDTLRALSVEEAAVIINKVAQWDERYAKNLMARLNERKTGVANRLVLTTVRRSAPVIPKSQDSEITAFEEDPRQHSIMYVSEKAYGGAQRQDVGFIGTIRATSNSVVLAFYFPRQETGLMAVFDPSTDVSMTLHEIENLLQSNLLISSRSIAYLAGGMEGPSNYTVSQILHWYNIRDEKPDFRLNILNDIPRRPQNYLLNLRTGRLHLYKVPDEAGFRRLQYDVFDFDRVSVLKPVPETFGAASDITEIPIFLPQKNEFPDLRRYADPGRNSIRIRRLNQLPEEVLNTIFEYYVGRPGFSRIQAFNVLRGLSTDTIARVLSYRFRNERLKAFYVQSLALEDAKVMADVLYEISSLAVENGTVQGVSVRDVFRHISDESQRQQILDIISAQKSGIYLKKELSEGEADFVSAAEDSAAELSRPGKESRTSLQQQRWLSPLWIDKRMRDSRFIPLVKLDSVLKYTNFRFSQKVRTDLAPGEMILWLKGTSENQTSGFFVHVDLDTYPSHAVYEKVIGLMQKMNFTAKGDVVAVMAAGSSGKSTGRFRGLIRRLEFSDEIGEIKAEINVKRRNHFIFDLYSEAVFEYKPKNFAWRKKSLPDDFDSMVYSEPEPPEVPAKPKKTFRDYCRDLLMGD